MQGDRYIYYMLEQYDPEFATLFKVAADMSEDVSRAPETTLLFARMVKTLQQRDQLLPLDHSGVARVVEYARDAMEDSEKLSLHRGRLADLLTESDFRARKAGAELINAEHVSAAAHGGTTSHGPASRKISRGHPPGYHARGQPAVPQWVRSMVSPSTCWATTPSADPPA